MIVEDIRKHLFEKQDEKYRILQIKIIPTAEPGSIIGVRTPELKDYAKQLSEADDISDFLEDIPHEYFEENQLHSFIVSRIRDYDKCIEEVRKFLPYVNNWATCDQMSPKVFRKHRTELLSDIREWINDDRTYTVRFAIKMLMDHFLDEDFDAKYPKMVAKIRSEDYYVRMMAAWYFATALAKQYDATVPFIEKRCLDRWTHNKAIQKSTESYRISPEKKEYLRSLKIH